ncbi:MAG: S41 family peptidase [Bdellovibrionales bacterium]|nr:S41 family peptidase [Bdellovibrionales bacterium]
MRFYARLAFIVLIGFVGIILGSMSSKTIMAVAQEKYSELQTFSKVLNLVQQYYVEEVQVSKLIQGAIKGMLNELDPHTSFMSADTFKEFKNETSGEFAGLGVEISVQDEILTVISPIEDTPAFKAGVQAGDKIVSIDGKSTKGLNLVEAAQLIKGKIGTIVKLNIFRKGFEKPKEFPVKRSIIKIKSVKYTDLEDGYAYVKLTSFIEKSADDFGKAVSNHAKKYKGTKGLIIDLRNNPGGLLTQAVGIADLFLSEGVIVSTIGRNKKEKEVISAKKDGTFPDFPIIVLQNEASASASEILAGALRDNKRAVIMGQRSFGKGSVQSVIELGNGSGLKLTVARYYTPSGVSIQASGIVPDITLENVNNEAYEKAIIKTNSRRESDIEGHLEGDLEKKMKEAKDFNPSDVFWTKNELPSEGKTSKRNELLRKDFQLLQAYNYLKAWRVFKNR